MSRCQHVRRPRLDRLQHASEMRCQQLAKCLRFARPAEARPDDLGVFFFVRFLIISDDFRGFSTFSDNIRRFFSFSVAYSCLVVGISVRRRREAPRMLARLACIVLAWLACIVNGVVFLYSKRRGILV